MILWYKFFSFFLYYVEVTFPLLLLFCYLIRVQYPRLSRGIRISVYFWAILVISPLPQHALIQLESQYPRWDTAQIPQDIEGIILLGGYHNTHASQTRLLPVYGKSSARFFEILPLLVQNPHLKLLLTGQEYSTFKDWNHIERQRLKFLGLDPQKILIESQSQTTKQNAALTAELLGEQKKKPWLLVTSAFHMHRAIELFKEQGINILPYPVDYRTSASVDYTSLFNLARSLNIYRMIAREYVGRLVSPFLPS